MWATTTMPLTEDGARCIVPPLRPLPADAGHCLLPFCCLCSCLMSLCTPLDSVDSEPFVEIHYENKKVERIATANLTIAQIIKQAS